MILNSIQTKLSKAVSVAKTQYYKLIVLAEDDEKKRARLISDFAGSYGVDVINLNLHLSKRLLEKSAQKRVSALLEELRDIVAADATLVVLNHCEILFNKELMNDPLKLLENISRNRTILVAWPGKCRGGHLMYATPDHPEYRYYENPDILIVSDSDAL